MSNVYVMDTNALIYLHVNYPRGTFPSVWSNFEDLVGHDRIISPRAVLEEVSRQDDQVHEWCKRNRNVFKRDTGEITKRVMEIIHKFPKLLHHNRPRREADPYIIALASLRTGNLTGDKPIIVTPEKNEKNKIPHVAKEYGLESIKLVDVFGKEGWQF